MPLGGLTPSRWNVSGCSSGHSTVSRSFCITADWPPMSEYRIRGVSTNRDRMAEGRTDGKAATKSEIVKTRSDDACRAFSLFSGSAVGFFKDRLLLIAIVPA